MTFKKCKAKKGVGETGGDSLRLGLASARRVLNARPKWLKQEIQNAPRLSRPFYRLFICY